MKFPVKSISVSMLAIILFTAFAVRAFAQSDTSADPTESDSVTTVDPLAQQTTLSDGTPYTGANPTDQDITVQTTPTNPGPYQSVAIRLTSNSIDLSKSMIVWSIDGVSGLSGIGVRAVSAQTKGYGQTVTIAANISGTGDSITKTIVLQPEDLTVLWEAVDAYAPPFYPGKKLPGKESTIKIAALPNFSGVSASNAVYKWQRNGNVVSEASGYGDSTFTLFQNNARNDENVDVTATTVDGSSQAEQSVDIPTFNPFILFYQTDASGVRNPIAQSTVSLTGSQTTIDAVPYFFSTKNNTPADLSYTWALNGNQIPITNPKDPETLVLQNPGSSGTATIDASVSNPQTAFQSAERALDVIFRTNR